MLSRDSPVVHLIPSEDVATLTIEENAGTDPAQDRMHVRVFGFGNAERGQMRLVATFDNLGKGAGGRGGAELNIMAGFDQTVGLVL